MSHLYIFDGGLGGQWYTDGSWPEMANLTTRTICFWAGWGDGVIDAAPEIGADDFLVVGRSVTVGVPSNWRLYYHGPTDTLRLESKFGTANGVWSASVHGNGMNAIDRGTFIAVTYDSSSTTNDPVFYSSGSGHAALTSRTVTEVTTPAGAQPSADGGRTRAFDSRLNENGYCFADLRVYSRILSANEIHNIWKSRGRNRNPYGLSMRLAPRVRGRGVSVANVSIPNLGVPGGFTPPAGFDTSQSADSGNFAFLNINPTG